MVQAKELRIGNWVNLCFKHKEGWFPARVTAIHKDLTLDTDTKESKRDRYYWEGLIISDELLDKTGFRLVTGEYPGWYANEFKGYSMRIYKRDDGSFRYSINDFISIEIKHLHQLQNLYFALTGQELEIKL